MLEKKQELIDFIKENNFNDIFINENKFFNKYGVNLYVYLRVSTDKQDFGRQLIELYEWAKKKNITIYIDNIYCDRYTGKKLDRNGYQTLKSKIKTNDYLLTTNLNRLGRNWDDIKKEWYELECNNINRIIQDNDNLSVQLPSEKKEEMTLNKKMIQDITFSACLYSACQKIEEVSQSTKDGLKKAKMRGKTLGRPTGKYATRENYLKTLELHANGLSLIKATNKTLIPLSTFKYWMKEDKKKYNIESTQELYKILKGGKNE